MMTEPKRISKTMNVFLWLGQAVLAALLIWSGMMKLFLPIAKLSAMFPWTGQVSLFLVKFTGVIDMLGAVGLILPLLVRIRPGLTAFAALGLVVLMICSSVFHVLRGEGSVIGLNIALAGIAAFVAWGRFRESAVEEK